MNQKSKDILDIFERQILKELLELDMDKFKTAPLGIATSAVCRARKVVERKRYL